MTEQHLAKLKNPTDDLLQLQVPAQLNTHKP